ncbi:MAG TPA: hypothetical protein VLG39_02885 [Nitrospirota bacterium]|nr:hypothetical protein [Nitrospirota bacterium]
MDRREFLIGLGIALVAGPAAISLNSCGSSSSSGSPAPANTFSVTSNPDNTGHSHNVFIPFADLTNPPAGGQTYTSDGSHVHQITLTQQQLTDINNGGSDSVTSTVVLNHSHEWTIRKPAA